MMKQNNSERVLVKTSARLHMGFFDLSGASARRFGSLGLSLNAPNTWIELAKGERVFSEDAEPIYVQKSKQSILNALNVDSPVSIRLQQAIPRHSGLGSGTQMALAIGAGINKLFGMNLSLAEIAMITGRGLRSGIGIGTFEQGGLVVDGGGGERTQVPPIIARHDFPSDWRILLMFDHTHTGVHGQQELKAFNTLKDAPVLDTMQNAHVVLMQALPALKEQDLTHFGQAILKLQAYTGGYFAPAQGGMYASQAVAKALNFLVEQGIHCVGQTSWGPTGFAVFEDEASAQYHNALLAQHLSDTALTRVLVAANNKAASVEVIA